jgi:protein gp37
VISAGCNMCYSFFMADKKNKKGLTRGQKAEAKRMSGQAGMILSYEKYVNPGVGAVFPKTGRKLTVSEELANFRADPRLKKKKKG